MHSIFKWLRRTYYRVTQYPAHRRYRLATETQQQMFYRWARQPSPDFREDDWKAAQVQVERDMREAEERRAARRAVKRHLA